MNLIDIMKISTSMFDDPTLKKIRLFNGNLLDVPKSQWTRQYIIEAVSHNPSILNAIPKEYRNEEINFRAVQTNPLNIRHLDRSERTTKIALEAIKGDNHNAASILSLEELTEEVLKALNFKIDYKLSMLANAFLYKHDYRGVTFYSYPISKEIPLVKEILSLGLTPTKSYYDWIRMFQGFNYEYITTQVYPYLNNPVKWALDHENALLNLSYNINRSVLDYMIFNDTLDYLKTLSFSDRETYVERLYRILSDKVLDDKTSMKIINSFPELKLGLLNGL